MKYAVIISILSSANIAIAQDCLLMGKWVSNEQMTLKSMNESGRITDKQKELFSKDFFGKLKLTYTCSSVTSFYEGSSTVTSYEMVRNDAGGFTIKSVGDDVVKSDQDIWFTDDHSCYYSVVGKLNFKEYFCKFR